MILSAIFPAINLVRYLAVSSSVFGLWNVICMDCFFIAEPSLKLDVPLYESGGQVIRKIVGQKPSPFDSIAAISLLLASF